LKFME